MENKILSLFLYNDKLKFNEIEKQTKIHSNNLAYYLKKLTQEKILKKENGFYLLNKESEHIIPYLDSRTSILPVILICLKKENKIFLVKRTKKPYKDKLGLPGGRILLGENLKTSIKRIMRKYHINATLKKINSVSIEQVIKNKKTIHTFLLIFATAETKDEILYFDIEKNKKQIISSDYNLIKNDFGKEIEINEIISKG